MMFPKIALFVSLLASSGALKIHVKRTDGSEAHHGAKSFPKTEGDLCARHDAKHASLYTGPPTFEHLLARDQVCDASVMAPHLTSLNISYNATQLNGKCNKLCGCAADNLFCPCVKHQIVNLMAVAGTFFNRHNLTWFLFKGSAIGALRHGGFMPADQDHDADWGIMLENDDDVDRFKKALRDIDDFLAAQNFPRRGFVSYQVDNFTEKGNGQQEAWIMSLLPSPAKAKKDSTAANSSSFLHQSDGIYQSMGKTQGVCFGECPEGEVFMNSKLDVVVCKPAPSNTHDNIICHARRPQEFKRSDMLPLTECQFHGGAWPCANQPQIMVETYYNDSSLRRHYHEEWQPNGTSLECLREN